MEYGANGEGGAVLEGLHPRYGPTSLQEHINPGTKSQLGSLPDPLVTPKRHPEGTLTVPRAMHEAPPPPPGHTNNGRSTLRGDRQGDV